jgi:hypothetical protein
MTLIELLLLLFEGGILGGVTLSGLCHHLAISNRVDDYLELSKGIQPKKKKEKSTNRILGALIGLLEASQVETGLGRHFGTSIIIKNLRRGTGCLKSFNVRNTRTKLNWNNLWMLWIGERGENSIFLPQALNFKRVTIVCMCLYVLCSGNH